MAANRKVTMDTSHVPPRRKRPYTAVLPYSCVLAAITRATGRYGGAVTRALISQQLVQDEDLEPGRRVNLQSAIRDLTRAGEIRTLHAVPERSAKQRAAYYQTQDQPDVIAERALLDMDKVALHAIRFWLESNGQPFSAKWLADFVHGRTGFAASAMGSIQIGRCLTRLQREQFLVRVNAHTWVPQAAWSRLSEEERERARESVEARMAHMARMARMAPARRRNSSMCEILRGLIAGAKQMQATPTRPVRIEDIVRTAKTWPSLNDSSERRRLHRALRQRAWHWSDERVELADGSEFVYLGAVRGQGWYDVARTAEGSAYVAYLEAKDVFVRANLSSVFEALREATMLPEYGGVHLPVRVVAARAALLCAEAASLSSTLERAAHAATLLIEERGEVDGLLANAQDIGKWAGRLIGSEHAGKHAMTSASFETGRLIDSYNAWNEVKAFAGFEVNHPTTLMGRFPTLRTVRRARAMEDATLIASVPARLHSGRAARQYKTGNTRAAADSDVWFDRTAFACYVAKRYGDARIVDQALLAEYILGELRDPVPLIAALNETPHANRSAHRAIAAALSFLDDAMSRAALAEYLERAVREQGAGEASTNIAGADAAVLGLARLPAGGLAIELAGRERRALEGIARSGEDYPLRQTAARVLRSWDEAWSGQQLLTLSE